MDMYSHLLRSSCETWFKNTYPNLSSGVLGSSYPQFRIVRPDHSGEELPELELKLSIGPWKSVYVWFKSPGAVLAKAEKEAMNQLRSEGCRVAIVRHLEDFKTLVHTLLNPVRQFS